ncbi:MAG: alpha/beta hydrolase domain-containing protein [Acidimicrobiales bacterium]
MSAPRPDGPAATLAPLAGGAGINLLVAGPAHDLAAAGYVEDELSASGTAISYRPVGRLGPDGDWTVEPDASATYATRIVVRRPADAAAFNGTVVVEWFNVTAGTDTAADLAAVGEELLRRGYAYVGVSVQALGIEGGDPAIPVGPLGAAVGLRASDPARYGGLHHPGDSFSYDILTQIGRALRTADGAAAALGTLEPDRILAIGESQSAFRLTTYLNGVEPLTRVYDGYLVHSRGRSAAALTDGGEVAQALTGPPIRIRTDGSAPVLIVEAEGDLIGRLDYLPARQDDTDTVRLWEMAGTAHADLHTAGDIGAFLGCAEPINSGPAHYILNAALRQLDAWVTTGEVPPAAPRIEVDAAGAIVRDVHGNALGGIRTPPVDVPVATLSGEPQAGPVICSLFGSTKAFDLATLTAVHGTREAYLATFEASLDATIAAGFLLADDRAAMLAEAGAVSFA